MKKPSAFPSARIEAERLTCLIEHGTTAAAVRELIAISPEIEAELRRDAEPVPSGTAKRPAESLP